MSRKGITIFTSSYFPFPAAISTRLPSGSPLPLTVISTCFKIHHRCSPCACHNESHTHDTGAKGQKSPCLVSQTEAACAVPLCIILNKHRDRFHALRRAAFERDLFSKENASIRLPGQRRRARYHSAFHSRSIRNSLNALSVTGTTGSNYYHSPEKLPRDYRQPSAPVFTIHRLSAAS